MNQKRGFLLLLGLLGNQLKYSSVALTLGLVTAAEKRRGMDGAVLSDCGSPMRAFKSAHSKRQRAAAVHRLPNYRYHTQCNWLLALALLS